MTGPGPILSLRPGNSYLSPGGKIRGTWLSLLSAL